MVFSINNDLGISETSEQVLTLYANGGKKIKLALSNCNEGSCKQYEFRTGAAITTKIQKQYYFQTLSLLNRRKPSIYQTEPVTKSGHKQVCQV